MSRLKDQVRQDVRRLRRELDPEVKAHMDRQIRENLLALPVLCHARIIYVYASMRGEVDTWQWIEKLWEKAVKTAFPRVEGEEIRFYFAGGREDLAPGAMGIAEPVPGRCEPAFQVDAPVITPGLAFSPRGDRLGYGGGYYDRFFLREPFHVRIGVAYPFQIREDVGAEEFDQKMNQIVMPSGVGTVMNVIGTKGKKGQEYGFEGNWLAGQGDGGISEQAGSVPKK